MKNLLIISLALFSGLLAAGCSSSPAVPATASISCQTAAGAGHSCVTYTGPGVGSGQCGGNMMVSSCPTASAIGTCTSSVSAGGVTETTATTYYSDSGTMASAEQTACTEGGGKWSAAGGG